MIRNKIGPAVGAVVLGWTVFYGSLATAQTVPGGTLDPTTIPKYVTPLVIPPEMPKSTSDPTVDYQIAVRQFQQQILPPTDRLGAPLPPTTVWGYGSVDHPGTVAQGGTFNNPSLTVEATKDKLTRVRWINDLTDPATGAPLPHLFDVDRTLHWANPELATCADGTARTDCRPDPLQPANAVIDFTQPYTGPVPMVVHVHGAHTDAAYDGYTEAWYLPASASGLTSPVTGQSYAIFGAKVNQLVDRNGVVDINTVPGEAVFDYQNDQPSTTLWYHDHSLGMTRLNVAAASAGFWLIRENGNKETGLAQKDRNNRNQRLPCCAPGVNVGAGQRFYEIPLAIQDRSFNVDGSLFYPADRAFFEGLSDGQVASLNPQMIIDFIDDPRFTGAPTPSDISPIWNPEAFFNTMVVNGNTWPFLDVEPRRYRLRLLNANDSRFLNLTLRVVLNAGADGINGTADDMLGAELPFYMIGAEQGLTPDVVEVTAGQTRTFLDDGTIVVQPTRDPLEALLMGPAERPDVIVDFTGLAPGTVVRIINTAPDAPFGGFPDDPADLGTTGQVMEFRVNLALRGQDQSTPPQDLVLIDQTAGTPAPSRVRTLALLEEGSGFICVAVDAVGEFLVPIQQVVGDPALDCADAAVDAAAFGPQAAVLGNVDALGFPSVQLWADAIEQNPVLGATEEWQFWNFSADAHPIHVHLVGFEVLGRQDLMLNADGEAAVPGVPVGTERGPLAWETGFKDTVSALPGEITRIKATFDLPGLYVWHCHILSHEDNEMMVPYCIGNPATGVCSGNTVVPGA